jgi:hypothetical protein
MKECGALSHNLCLGHAVQNVKLNSHRPMAGFLHLNQR